MQKNPEIREIEESDLAGFQQLFPHWKAGNVQKKLGKTLKSKRVKRFVAELDGKIVGHIKCVPSRGRHSHITKLYSLAVLPEHREKGIGTALTQYAEKQMPERIKLVVFQVQAGNEKAIQLYKKLGYKQYGFLEKGSIVEGKMMDNLLMKKEIHCRQD